MARVIEGSAGQAGARAGGGVAVRVVVQLPSTHAPVHHGVQLCTYTFGLATSFRRLRHSGGIFGQAPAAGAQCGEHALPARANASAGLICGVPQAFDAAPLPTCRL
jgi:hypothetical protein